MNDATKSFEAPDETVEAEPGPWRIRVLDGRGELRTAPKSSQGRYFLGFLALMGLLLAAWGVAFYWGSPALHCERGGDCVLVRQTLGHSSDRFPATALLGAEVQPNDRGGDGTRVVLVLETGRVPLTDLFDEDRQMVREWAEAIGAFASGRGSANLALAGDGTLDALGIAAIGLAIALGFAHLARHQCHVTIDPASGTLYLLRSGLAGTRRMSVPLAELEAFDVLSQHYRSTRTMRVTLVRVGGGHIAKVLMPDIPRHRRALRAVSKLCGRPVKSRQA